MATSSRQGHQDTTTTRLDRIEDKLDALTSAMVSIARAEEKISTLMQDHEKMHERLNRFSQKLDDIDKKVEDNARTVATINKLFLAVIVAVIGTLVSQYLN